MRIMGISTIAIACVCGASLFGATAALAQSSGPSAQQIIQALKPSGSLSSTTRGIVPLPQGNGTIAPQQAAPGVHSSAMHMQHESMQHHAMHHNGAIMRQPATSAPSINLNIDFAMGSANLTPQARTELDRLGHALTDQSLAAYHFKLVGHTDTTGSASTNLSLSQARAKAVDDYLVSKFNIAPGRIAATGVGENDLLVQTGPNVANQANRRVQVINTGK